MTAGYSATPLAKKLGLKDGLRIWWDGMPENIGDSIRADVPALALLDMPDPPIEAAHLFVSQCAILDCKLRLLLPLLDRAGFIWVSWPKQTSGVTTDITEDVIRAVALPLGLVDVKVCSVDETWSALKLVIRKALR